MPRRFRHGRSRGHARPMKSICLLRRWHCDGMPVSLIGFVSHRVGRREKTGCSPDGRCRDEGILEEEGAGCADNRDVAFSRANGLADLMNHHHAGAAAGVYRRARACRSKK